MNILTVVGARPQFIKAAVVSRAIAARNNDEASINEIIVHTGQHYDISMSDIFFHEMQIPAPDYNLNINGRSHGAMTGQMMERIEQLLVELKPEIVLVYGDTNSTLAGALAAVKLHIPVAHVEAGLRSFNKRMPEEINRVLTDHVADILFCPTVTAVQNLAKEGIAAAPANPKRSPQGWDGKKGTYLVGDVMYDATLFYRQFSRRPDFRLPENFILATVHRAENTDDPGRLNAIMAAFKMIGEEMPIVLPLHPRTRKILGEERIQKHSGSVRVLDPVGYFEMMYLLDNCRLVMTDSGGLQKEAYFFQKPCLTLRDETEWVELLELGVNIVCGADTDTIRRSYLKMRQLTIKAEGELYGNGSSGEKIVDILMQ
jgi:UDP-GlcNAc3NAcA epimerase